ncbi:unnamed protein product [Prunus armeniaca]|uniref:Uncharacterized protein n=1 Tax=Prunus armeniaca TaxID=36596 RepID=A0A6J5X995_PRUAR|nr:unnamed protein product [Prunus armeniaca]CAB4308562.1 unnamed protein product [Prunus armeniaca]
MPSQAYWRKTGHVPIKPLVYYVQPGRPKLSKNKEPDEIPRGGNLDVLEQDAAGGEDELANASGMVGVRGRGVVKGICVVSEQQQTQATPKLKRAMVATGEKRSPCLLSHRKPIYLLVHNLLKCNIPHRPTKRG